MLRAIVRFIGIKDSNRLSRLFRIYVNFSRFDIVAGRDSINADIRFAIFLNFILQIGGLRNGCRNGLCIICNTN